MDSNILELKNIEKNFDKVEVLKDINLAVKKGEIISLLGLSGSGKSTILNIISGFEKPCKGEVSYKTHTLSNNNEFVEPQDRNIGFVFQNYALFPHLNIYDNITFGISKKSREEKDKIVNGLLKLINLEGFEKRFPHELSGGQQQRIALVRSMALNPDLILLDEPFSSIDSMAKASIQSQLLKILKGSNKTAIIVTHDPKEAMALSDRIVYLEKGKIVQFDTPKNIYENPKTKLIAKSFGKANFIEKDCEQYCIRPKFCTIDKTSGDIKAKIEEIIDFGESLNITITFKYDSQKYDFLIIEDSNAKNFSVDEEVFLTIDFNEAKKIEN